MANPISPGVGSARRSGPSAHNKGRYIERALVRNRPLILLWRVALIVAAIVGIILAGNNWGSKLSYFTIQSNILLAACIAYAAWKTLEGTRGPSPALKGAVTVYIAITGLVYNFILIPIIASTTNPVFISPLSNFLLHTLTPIMAVIDWIMFDEHGSLNWLLPLYWLCYPLAYGVFALIRGLFLSGPNRYPYPFLDVDQLGYGGVALNAVIYGLAFWLIGMAFVALDWGLARLIHRWRSRIS